MDRVQPVEIQKRDDGSIRVAWSDGHEGIYPASYLRENCHCAACIEEWTGRKMIRPDMIPPDIRPLHISAVGQYAIHIEWSDGHSTGIYPFDLLRRICPCPACVSERAVRP